MFSNKQNQYLGAFCILLLVINCGTNLGWNSPSYPVLMSDESPLPSGPLTLEQIAWTTALLSPGGLIGTFLFGTLLGTCGRRLVAFLLGMLQITTWLLFIFAQSPVYFYVGRFITGLSGSGSFYLMSLFTTEIAEADNRGFLGSLLYLMFNFGVLLGIVIGVFVNCLTAPWIYVGINLLSFSILLYLPDTPYYFARKGLLEEAEKSLRFYRCLQPHENPKSFINELSDLEVLSSNNSKNNQNAQSSKLKLSDLCTKISKKAIPLSIMLGVVYVFSGCYPMLSYTTHIFKEAGSSFTPNTSAIIIALIQLVGGYLSTILVERTGRKTLLLSSAVGTCFGHICFGSYSFFSQYMDLTDYTWIPLLSFSFIIFAANCGVLNLPYLLIPEVLPTKLRGPFTGVIYSTMYLMNFFLLRFLPIITENFGFHFIAFSLAFALIFSVIYFLIFLPETKGKTLSEIQEFFSK